MHMPTPDQLDKYAARALELRDTLIAAAAAPSADERGRYLDRADAHLELLAAALGFQVVALEAEAA